MAAGEGWRRRVPICSPVAPRLGKGRYLPLGGNRSEACSRGDRSDRAAAGIEQPKPARAMPHGVTPVEMPAHEHAELCTRAPARLFGQLHDRPVEDDGVVARHHALLLMTEDLLEVDGAERDE